MAGLFGRGTRASSTNPVETTLRVQTSIQGRPRTIGAGQTRQSANCTWYGDFTARPDNGTGKGGGGSSGKGNTGSYKYSASFILSLGAGPIAGVQSIINGNQIDFLVTPPASVLADLKALGITPTYGNSYGGTFLLGGYTQAAWSYLTSKHPDQALAYRGEALACFANMSLGNSASLPNFNFELLWGINSDIPALGPDANPADWVAYVLSDADEGVGFPAALIGDLSGYQAWCRATGMLISPVLSSQQAAQSHLADIMTGTVADFRWSSGLLTIVPYAESTVTGNGFTYAPPVTPIYDLTDDDFLVNQGSLGSASSGDTPIAVLRKDPAQVLNKVQIEYLDRSNLYNPVILYDSDDAAIVAANRLKISDLRAHHFFCLGSAASRSASLQLHREKIVTQYQFTLPSQFMLLDPMDIVTINSVALGLVQQPVCITEIQENTDRSLTMTSEEFLGRVTAPLIARQKPAGAARNINIDPGPINPPILFEPPDQLGGGLEIWAAISGQMPAVWGGCIIWASTTSDGTYAQVAAIAAPARQGVLTSSLATIARASVGQTIDQTNTLAVSLVESAGTLASGSNDDMTALNTLVYVDGELIAYQTATLTGANAYSLAPLVRGAYGSTIGAHAAGSAFARLDDAIGQIAYTQDRIGSTLYLKVQSYNIYGGGLQDLSTLSPYAYTITGAALASPLPNVQNLRTYFEAGVMKLFWDEVVDFRAVQYEIRKGNAWTTALKVATQAHPPFVCFGDDTYWVAAVSQPVAGLMVYSGTPGSIAVTGALLSQNVVEAFDEQALGWPGIFANGVGTQGLPPVAYLKLGGAGNILSDPDILNTGDVLNYGGVIASGSYEIPSSHWVDAGFVAQCLCGASYKGTGSPVGQDILSVTDFLSMPDVLGAGSAQFVDVHVEIAVSQVGPSPTWGPWQKFVPGVYTGRMFKFRVVLTTIDSQTVPYCLGFSFQVTVPGRTDHYLQQAVPSGGLALTFKPDGVATAGAFNGGPNGAALPAIAVNYQNGTGDSYIITGLTAAGLTIQFFDKTGSPVARTADIIVQGY